MNVELVKRVLSTNVYVDRLNQPRSALFLLWYEPQIGSFLEGPTIPRSQEVRIDPTVLFVAQPATTSTTSEAPDLIPSRQVSEMAPPINPFKFMGKTASGSPSETGKSKGKGKAKGTGARKKGKKPISEPFEPELPIHSAANEEPPCPLPVIHELDESNHGDELAPRKKRARLEASSVPTQGASSDFEACIPILCSGQVPSLFKILS